MKILALAILFSLAPVAALTAERPVAVASGVSSAAPKVLLDQRGNGISNTRRFHAPGDWYITYSFSHCQISGFAIYVKGAAFDEVSTAGGSGHGIDYEHSGGSVYLTVNSACSWHVTAFAGGKTVSGIGLKVSGNGIVNTQKFRVPSEWKIVYSFSHCEIPGFDVYVKGDAFDIMSKSTGSGHGVQYEHSGGTVYLTVNSACSWRLAVSK